MDIASLASENLRVGPGMLKELEARYKEVVERSVANRHWDEQIQEEFERLVYLIGRNRVASTSSQAEVL